MQAVIPEKKYTPMNAEKSHGLALSGNTLKLIAAVSMLIDHAGVILFPDLMLLRVLGRLAFPLFAFMIAEGARYTRNRLRYLLGIAVLGGFCQLVYLAVGGDWHMNTLLTFTLSILLIYSLDYAKRVLLTDGRTRTARILAVALPLLATAAAALLTAKVSFDYGFIGCTMPLLASLLSFRGLPVSERLARLDTVPNRALTMLFGLVPLCIKNGPLHLPSLLAVLLLFLYSGKRGRFRMKYFFYLFYPLHLAILWGIYMLIHYL